MPDLAERIIEIQDGLLDVVIAEKQKAPEGGVIRELVKIMDLLEDTKRLAREQQQ